MTHDDKHRMALAAIDVAWGEGRIEADERQELRRWLAAAADALRLQGLGAHDRDLVEFLGDERDRAVAELARINQAWASAESGSATEFWSLRTERDQATARAETAESRVSELERDAARTEAAGAQRFLREAHEVLTQAGAPQSPTEAHHLMDSALVRRIRWLAGERDKAVAERDAARRVAADAIGPGALPVGGDTSPARRSRSPCRGT